MTEKRVAIVTGGTRGIGKDISIRLAMEGFVVVAVSLSDSRDTAETERTLRNITSDSAVMAADVSDSQQVRALVGEIIQRYERIDILINNAGIFEFMFLEELDENSLDKIMNVNFKGQFLMMKEVIQFMKKNQFGRIINASSISGEIADVGLIAYAASKASVNMMTKIAAAELAPYNITVNAYAPGIIHTDMTYEMIRERGDVQVKQIPLNRFGTGSDVAALVNFLVSDEAGYITGEIIGVDGGFFKVQNPYRAHEYAEEGS